MYDAGVRILTQRVPDHRGRTVEVDCLGAVAAAYPVTLAVLQAVGCGVSALLPHEVTVGLTLLVFVLLFTSPLMLVGLQAALAPRQVSRLLLGRECPSCRYGLVGVPVQGDGCTVCPECRAAWRLEAEAGGAARPPGR